MYCGEWSLVKRTHPGLTVIPLRCRCWTCDECRSLRKAQLVAEAIAGQPTIFITLTSRNRASTTPHQAAQALAVAWRQVRREYIKKHGRGSLAFVAVFEATKRGWPHLHIAARAKWVDQVWLSKRMAHLIGAPIVDVRRIKGLRKVAAYVSKYIGKNPQRFEGTKRYWRSKDYLLPAANTDENQERLPEPWLVVQMHWRAYVAEWELLGYFARYGRAEADLTVWAPP